MNIELDNVSKNFKNQTVLENVNLKLESGKIYGLVGRNCSGKSVLLNLKSHSNYTLVNQITSLYNSTISD